MKIPYVFITIMVMAVLTYPVTADESSQALQTAGALYSSSVDLANAGKYQEALDAADKALVMNVTSMTALIQSNRAGILVALHREDEAIAAADASLAVEGNLTTAHSIAWWNKGNALRALGKIPEAQDAYNHAYALDKTLVPPDMSGDVTLSAVATTVMLSNSPVTTARKSPVPEIILLAALGIAAGTVVARRKK